MVVRLRAIQNKVKLPAGNQQIDDVLITVNRL